MEIQKSKRWGSRAQNARNIWGYSRVSWKSVICWISWKLGTSSRCYIKKQIWPQTLKLKSASRLDHSTMWLPCENCSRSRLLDLPRRATACKLQWGIGRAWAWRSRWSWSYHQPNRPSFRGRSRQLSRGEVELSIRSMWLRLTVRSMYYLLYNYCLYCWVS